MVPRGCCNTILASIDFKSVGSLWRMGNSYHIILITEFNNQFRNYKYKVWVTTNPSPCDLPKPSNLYPQVNSEYFNHIYQTCKDLYNVHDVKSGYLKKKAFSWIWCYWVNIKYERKILKLFHNILILRKLLLKNRYQTLSRHP